MKIKILNIIAMAFLGCFLMANLVMADTQEVTPTGTSSDIRYFDGGVGIGTTTLWSGTKLEVVGPGEPIGGGFYSTTNILDGDVGNRGLYIGYDTGSTYNAAIASVSGPLEFWTYGYIGGGIWDWKEKVRITDSGNVGIGTTSPGSKLDVVTKADDWGFSLRNNTYSTLFTSGFKIYQDNNGGVHISTNDGSTLNIDTAGNMTVGGSVGTAGFAVMNGNVGIGTTTPSTKLEVVGGPIKAAGGLIIETRTSDPTYPETGRIWLRTDF